MLRKFKKMIYFFGGSIALLLICVTLIAYFSTSRFLQFGGRLSEKQKEKLILSPHYNGDQFVNSIETKIEWTFSESISMMSDWIFSKNVTNPGKKLPVEIRTSASFKTIENDNVTVTWLGHATAVIDIEGFRILTDPVWSSKPSFSSLIGPERFHPVPITIEEIHDIDAVLISHDHYDHLDMASIQKLNERNIIFYVPLGVGIHLDKWGVDKNNIIEFDWYDSLTVGQDNLRLIATPARHFSGRSPLYGTNPTLWVSWVILGKKHKVYFSGDTGYFSEFKKIRELYGPFDFALLAIGAYNEKWKEIHLNPEEAVKVHEELQGGILIPIHWGTFNLALHDWYEPAERLVSAAEKSNVKYYIPIPGELVKLNQSLINSFWWQEHINPVN